MTEHYFSAEPLSDARPREIDFNVQGRHYTLSAATGVFSASHLDTGTGVLLRKGKLPGPETIGAVLDLGCGYGPIATVLATVAPHLQVWAVDVNIRARELTKLNAKDLDITVATPEEVPVDVMFQQIWSNPPIRVGKADLHELLLQWLPRLVPGGTAWLVVAQHKGADSLQKWLIEQGWPCARHASGAGYRVFKVTRPEPV